MDFEFEIEGRSYKGSVKLKDGIYRIDLGERVIHVDLIPISEYLFSLIIDGRSHRVFLVEGQDGIHVWIDGEGYRIQEPRRDIKRKATSYGTPREKKALTTVMPGRVVKVMVSDGDEVEAGDPLVIVEAMKMENQIQAPHRGKIRRVFVSAGDQINFGDTILEFV
jgi:acetyl/propionyl-CoA carboxylase alpha subunit